MRGPNEHCRPLSAPSLTASENFRNHRNLKNRVSCSPLGTGPEPAAGAVCWICGNLSEVWPGWQSRRSAAEWQLQLAKGINAMCVGAGRHSKREDFEASARHCFHEQNETAPCSAHWQGKDRSKANNRRGCREEEPPHPKLLKPLTPQQASLCAVTQLQTWKRADSSEERQDPLYEKHWKQTQIKGKHQAEYTAGAVFPC